MKKILLSLAFSWMAASSLFAAKAKPGVCRLMMTDGSYVSATLKGDENFHYYTLLDGTPLQKMTNGTYERSSTQALQARLQASMARKTRASSIGNQQYFPHLGTPKALVILVEFQDVKFKSTSPAATFNHYLNAEVGEAAPVADARVFSTKEETTNYGSVREYFKHCSLGKFVPQFDVVGPVTLSQNFAYYGNNRSEDDIDIHCDQMLGEACSLVDDQVDFSQYDADGDGCVDLVYVIYAGYSESISGNSDDCLWPKSGATLFYRYDQNGNPAGNLECDGMSFSRYGINNELNGTPKDTQDGKYLLNGIGLFCHEFSHTMGLPDHYPVSGSSTYADNQSPEYWDLMDAGEYTQDGYCPTPYTPWEKMMMGWIDPVTLSSTQAEQLTLEPYDMASKAYKIMADVDDSNFFINENYSAGIISEATRQNLKKRAQGEFLLLQNIRNEGWYKSLPGYGLLVWRIDYADKDCVSLYDYPNDIKGISRVMVVPADGLVINQMNCGDNNTYTWSDYDTSNQNDPFPAYGIGKDGSDVNSLTEVKFNWSTLTSRPLYNIKKDEATGMVTFDYLKDFASTGISKTIINITDKRLTEYYDMEGRKVKNPIKGHLYSTNKGYKMIF